MPESSFERFRRMMDEMDFETLPLFSKPQFSWNLLTDYIGRRFQYRPYTESTQDDARQVLTRWQAASGTILLAELQTAGRGRAGRSWISPPDVNLHFTLILYPVEDLRPLAYVTPLALAQAVEEAASRSGDALHVDLKWPNDVQIRGRKVGGVLIETALTRDGEDVALIGIGLNVNVDVDAYPEIADIATSVRDAIGHQVSREELLALFCNHFETLWEQEKAGDSDAAFGAWKSRLITLGAEVTATGPEGAVQGLALDVLRDGTLVIEKPGGLRVTVEAGDVTLTDRGS